MPSSDYFQIPTVIQAVTQLKPASVLDIGIGFGKWGALCREYLDADYGRVGKQQWKTRIDGIEIFEPYRNPLWEAVYDRVWIGDAIELLSRSERYDLVIACDIIEHYPKERGRAFLDAALKCAKVVLITSPYGHYPQDALFGNEHERHLSEWREEDFRDLPSRFERLDATFIAILASSESDLATVRLTTTVQRLGLRRGIVGLAGLAWSRLVRRS